MSTNPSFRSPDCEQGKPGRNRGKKEEKEDDKWKQPRKQTHEHRKKDTEKEKHNQKKITPKLPQSNTKIHIHMTTAD